MFYSASITVFHFFCRPASNFCIPRWIWKWFCRYLVTTISTCLTNWKSYLPSEVNVALIYQKELLYIWRSAMEYIILSCFLYSIGSISIHTPCTGLYHTVMSKKPPNPTGKQVILHCLFIHSETAISSLFLLLNFLRQHSQQWPPLGLLLAAKKKFSLIFLL